MSKLKSFTIFKGAKGYGGPLKVSPTEERNVLLYVTGGRKPDIVDYIAEVSGLELVDGFKTMVKDEKIALAVVSCGGVLRAGVYPQKKIPTMNVLNTGKSGPLAKFITPEIYVSGVTNPDQIVLDDI